MRVNKAKYIGNNIRRDEYKPGRNFPCIQFFSSIKFQKPISWIICLENFTDKNEPNNGYNMVFLKSKNTECFI